jgi:hypothetical protein
MLVVCSVSAGRFCSRSRLLGTTPANLKASGPCRRSLARLEAVRLVVQDPRPSRLQAAGCALQGCKLQSCRLQVAGCKGSIKHECAQRAQRQLQSCRQQSPRLQIAGCALQGCRLQGCRPARGRVWAHTACTAAAAACTQQGPRLQAAGCALQGCQVQVAGCRLQAARGQGRARTACPAAELAKRQKCGTVESWDSKIATPFVCELL